ncbi:MAG: M4 family metallopeptidase, partial [Nocardioides sp.]
MGKNLGRGLVGLAAAALVAGSLGAQTAGAAGAPAERDQRGDVVRQALRALDAHPGVARDTVEQEFHVVDTVIDADGGSHVRMTRTVHGVPVLGGDLVVHQGRGGAWEGVSQTLRTPLDLSVRPGLDKAAARNRALAPSAATRAISNLRTAGVPQLVIDAVSTEPRLAWEVSTAGRQRDGTPSRLLSYVDAATGKVLRREEQIHTTDGSGQSLYSGTVSIQVAPAGSGYTLTDPTRGNGTTVDAQNKTESILCQLLGIGCVKGVAFNSPDTSFGNGTNSNRESAAVDAHYGAATTYDYFKTQHGRNGIFGDGRGVTSRVHYGSNYVNAFWDGSKMTYGDGNGTTFGPLVSLDVAGHEMSHGVTENTAGLTYSGESGGLNEATSDIFGTMVEFYAANSNDPGDYYIGEEFDLAKHEGFRRMDNPSSDGSSVNCWSPTVGQLDVHYSSGVGNHFFYLLAEGSGQKSIGGKVHNSPTCNGSTITGIGRDAAQKIWFKALTTYFTSGTTYAQARTATLNAARD